MQLSTDDLDILVAIGAHELIQAKAAEYQRRKREAAALELAERRKAAIEGTPESAAAAVERVQRLIGRKPKARPPLKRS